MQIPKTLPDASGKIGYFLNVTQINRLN